VLDVLDVLDAPSRESASKPGQTLSERTYLLSIYPLESELDRATPRCWTSNTIQHLLGPHPGCLPALWPASRCHARLTLGLVPAMPDMDTTDHDHHDKRRVQA
jgi:hypothetical protein